MNKPLLPEKQRNAAKIKQGSPMKVRDTDNSDDLHTKVIEISNREDMIDVLASQHEQDLKKDQ